MLNSIYFEVILAILFCLGASYVLTTVLVSSVENCIANRKRDLRELRYKINGLDDENYLIGCDVDIHRFSRTLHGIVIANPEKGVYTVLTKGNHVINFKRDELEILQ